MAFWRDEVFDDILGFDPPKHHQQHNNPVNIKTNNAVAQEAASREQEKLQFEANQRVHADQLFEDKAVDTSISVAGESTDQSTEATLSN